MSDGGEEAPARVGIGLVRRGDRYLIRKRLEGQAMAGFWEFPGGKCEAGESPEAATARECLEEIGIAVAVGPLARRVVHRYPHGLVELSYLVCRTVDPTAEPPASSGFIWVDAVALPGYRFPEANDDLVAALARTRAD